jgi:hypothetical protein
MPTSKPEGKSYHYHEVFQGSAIQDTQFTFQCYHMSCFRVGAGASGDASGLEVFALFA